MDPVVHLTPTCGLKGNVSRLQLKKIAANDAKVRDVYSFLGIPYATPPVGDLRFREPQPLNLWSGIRDAKEFGAACLQDLSLLDMFPFDIDHPTSYSEDCLFLNIWTPTLDPGARLPVMFHIHGGGFVSGSSNICTGDVLANFHDVVVVSINYRLAAFGFLCTGDSVATGNYGLLDQIEALKFVKQHISCFGGDPDNITLFGVSAGAVSISLLILSPLAEGLFQRGICESGTCLMPGFPLPEMTVANSLRTLLDQKPGYPGSSSASTEIVEFLRKLPAEDIARFGREQFRPVVNAPFLAGRSDIRNLLSAAKCNCDLIIGCNNNEGFMLLEFVRLALGMDLANFDASTMETVLHGFRTTGALGDMTDEAFKAALKEYVKEESKTADDFMKAFAELTGDLSFDLGHIAVADRHSRSGKTYMYRFSHRSAFEKGPEWVLTNHGLEAPFPLGYVVRDNKPKEASAEDVELCHQTMSYWVNFAKTGDPNGEDLVHWPRYDETSKEYLILKLPAEPASHMKRERVEFWRRYAPGLFV
jgi:carboxylesterase 2